ncbi:MAG: type II toxin-antitoxin system HicA family toxin [Clostridia bacterium]|nr:type II toxin-antitoxin system HicA family toxin [Clostridia bacterium]
MSRRAKLWKKLQESPQNVRFDELEALAKALGFTVKFHGSHAVLRNRAAKCRVTVVRPHAGDDALDRSDVGRFVEEVEMHGLAPTDEEDG